MNGRLGLLVSGVAGRVDLVSTFDVEGGMASVNKSLLGSSLRSPGRPLWVCPV